MCRFADSQVLQRSRDSARSSWNHVWGGRVVVCVDVASSSRHSDHHRCDPFPHYSRVAHDGDSDVPIHIPVHRRESEWRGVDSTRMHSFWFRRFAVFNCFRKWIWKQPARCVSDCGGWFLVTLSVKMGCSYSVLYWSWIQRSGYRLRKWDRRVMLSGRFASIRTSEIRSTTRCWMANTVVLCVLCES